MTADAARSRPDRGRRVRSRPARSARPRSASSPPPSASSAGAASAGSGCRRSPRRPGCRGARCTATSRARTTCWPRRPTTTRRASATGSTRSLAAAERARGAHRRLHGLRLRLHPLPPVPPALRVRARLRHELPARPPAGAARRAGASAWATRSTPCPPWPRGDLGREQLADVIVRLFASSWIIPETDDASLVQSVNRILQIRSEERRWQRPWRPHRTTPTARRRRLRRETRWRRMDPDMAANPQPVFKMLRDDMPGHVDRGHAVGQGCPPVAQGGDR